MSKWVSLIFHPLFLSMYALVLLFNLKPSVFFNVPEQGRRIIYLIVFTYTVFLPLLTSFVLKRTGVIESYEMHTRAERKWAYLVTAASYFFCYWMMAKFPGLVVLSLMMLGASVGLLLLTLSNLFIKVSAHTTGMGGCCGMFCGLIFLLGIDYSLLLMGLFVLAGLVAWARLEAESHSETEVYLGFLLGFFSEFGLLMLFL